MERNETQHQLCRLGGEKRNPTKLVISYVGWVERNETQQNWSLVIGHWSLVIGKQRTTATREEVYERLSYLKEYQIGGFEKVNIEQATTSILSADQTNWRNLKPITKLRCGIGEAKVNTLKQVFRVE